METMIRTTVRSLRTRAPALAALLIFSVIYVAVASRHQLAAPRSSATTSVVAEALPARSVAADAAEAARATEVAYERYIARLLDLNTMDDARVEPPTLVGAAVYERWLENLRELNTSGDPAIDEPLLPMCGAGQWLGPY